MTINILDCLSQFRNGSTCTKDLGTFANDLIDTISERDKVIFLFNGLSSARQCEAGC